MKTALIVLANGSFFTGTPFGASGETIGEVVFNTSMSGYQEILTDPSYRGQLVTMTTSHVGNYGINPWDMESDRAQVAGFILREAARRASNYRATKTLHEFLVEQEIVGITGVDTRALTQMIRDAGAMMGAIVHNATEKDVPAIVERIHKAIPYEKHNYVAQASVSRPTRVVLQATKDTYQPYVVKRVSQQTAWSHKSKNFPHVVVIDYGVKNSILRYLIKQDLRVTLLPHNATSEQIFALDPDGILLSNGPGDPATLPNEIHNIKQILGKKPLFGICLGHQLLAQAVGGKTFKLKFGHRGPNQPVLDQNTGRVQITAQNHGYAVHPSFFDENISISHINLNDQTVEGLRIENKKAMSTQHHPEGAPGPHDAIEMFSEFRQLL